VQERYHPITKFFNKFTFNWQSLAIAVSEDVANSIQQAIKPSIPIVIVNNGVNVNKFKINEKEGVEIRNEYGIDTDCIIIGTVAVFRFQKRIKEWISVFKKVHQSFPHIRGCIIGDGLLKAEILSHLKEEKMENCITFPGLQINVIPWLSAVDIFMMTSEFEGLPIALLEAMSMNCAVVATNAGGVKEVIRNGVDGFIEDVNNWEKLEDPLTYLIQNPQEILNYGKKARKRVEDAYSINNMTNQLEMIYQSLSTMK
jgi:glycosyltransferase involved in cell wall biosynthesis